MVTTSPSTRFRKTFLRVSSRVPRKLRRCSPISRFTPTWVRNRVTPSPLPTKLPAGNRRSLRRGRGRTLRFRKQPDNTAVDVVGDSYSQGRSKQSQFRERRE